MCSVTDVLYMSDYFQFCAHDDSDWYWEQKGADVVTN